MDAPRPLVSDHMTANPLTMSPEDNLLTALETMRLRGVRRIPVTVTAETDLLEAAQTLHGTRYGALPVVSDGHVVGILTDNDLVRALVDQLRGSKADEEA